MLLQSFRADHTVSGWLCMSVSKACTLSTGSCGLPQIIWYATLLSTVPSDMNFLHLLCLASLSFSQSKVFFFFGVLPNVPSTCPFMLLLFTDKILQWMVFTPCFLSSLPSFYPQAGYLRSRWCQSLGENVPWEVCCFWFFYASSVTLAFQFKPSWNPLPGTVMSWRVKSIHLLPLRWSQNTFLNVSKRRMYLYFSKEHLFA